MDYYGPSGKKTTPGFTITGKTIFPCKVIDKDGNVKKIIPPEEFIKDSYRWHDHKWVKQPDEQDEQPTVPGTPPGNSTAKTAVNFKQEEPKKCLTGAKTWLQFVVIKNISLSLKNLSKALVILLQNIRQPLIKKAKELGKKHR